LHFHFKIIFEIQTTLKMDTLFKSAVEIVANLDAILPPGQLTRETSLELFGLYKQV
jgi:hypothetical protein